MGNFELAIALGFLLLLLTFGVNLILTRFQQQGQFRWPKPS
jgi:ABC-type tungstate transport system substrate-binding protein